MGNRNGKEAEEVEEEVEYAPISQTEPVEEEKFMAPPRYDPKPCPVSWFGDSQVRYWTVGLDPVGLTEGKTEWFALPCGCSPDHVHVGGILGFRLMWLPVALRTKYTHRLCVFAAGSGTEALAHVHGKMKWRCRKKTCVEPWAKVATIANRLPLSDEIKVGDDLVASDLATLKVTWTGHYDARWLRMVNQWTNRTTGLMFHDFGWLGPTALDVIEQKQMVEQVKSCVAGTLPTETLQNKLPPQQPEWPHLPTVHLPRLNDSDRREWLSAPTPKILSVGIV